MSYIISRIPGGSRTFIGKFVYLLTNPETLLVNDPFPQSQSWSFVVNGEVQTSVNQNDPDAFSMLKFNETNGVFDTGVFPGWDKITSNTELSDAKIILLGITPDSYLLASYVLYKESLSLGLAKIFNSQDAYNEDVTKNTFNIKVLNSIAQSTGAAITAENYQSDISIFKIVKFLSEDVLPDQPNIADITIPSEYTSRTLALDWKEIFENIDGSYSALDKLKTFTSASSTESLDTQWGTYVAGILSDFNTFKAGYDEYINTI